MENIKIYEVWVEIPDREGNPNWECMFETADKEMALNSANAESRRHFRGGTQTVVLEDKTVIAKFLDGQRIYKFQLETERK